LIKALVNDTSGESAETVLGGAKILLRAAVAAVLNAASLEINYPRTLNNVISSVNAALAICERDTILALATELDNDNNLGDESIEDCSEFLGGASFNISPAPYGGTDPLTVEDNDSNDKDATDGRILLENVPPGEYTITETVAPEGYQLDPKPQTANVVCDSPVTVTFYNTREECSGSIQIEKYDDEGALLGGASFNISPAPYGGTDPLTVVDNDSNDEDATDGRILLENVPPGEYTITEVVAPLGYVKTTDPQSVSVTCNSTETVTFYNTREECSGFIKIEKYDDEDPATLLPGAEFEVDPNPYGIGVLIVTDNDDNDVNPADGIVEIINIPCGNYTITETLAPEGYVRTTDSQTKTVSNGGTATFSFVNTIEHGCVGLTPGYWKNWRNHYNPGEFETLLEGTIADGSIDSIDTADRIFHPELRDFKGLFKLKSQLLATQLTLNLTKMPNMPNPDNAYLTEEDCSVEWNGEVLIVGDAVNEALAILANPRDYTREQILEVKDILDMINNLGG